MGMSIALTQTVSGAWTTIIFQGKLICFSKRCPLLSVHRDIICILWVVCGVPLLVA